MAVSDVQSSMLLSPLWGIGSKTTFGLGHLSSRTQFSALDCEQFSSSTECPQEALVMELMACLKLGIPQ